MTVFNEHKCIIFEGNDSICCKECYFMNAISTLGTYHHTEL